MMQVFETEYDPLSCADFKNGKPPYTLMAQCLIEG
jgi:hypothetical protein